jgi:hypothetical protein
MSLKADLLTCAHIVPANRVSHINSTLADNTLLAPTCNDINISLLGKRSYVHSGTCETYYHLHCRA